MRHLSRPALLTVLACASAALLAGPAPWYQWRPKGAPQRNKIDGKLVCAQTPLGPGWEKASGPYKDSHCEKRMAAK